MHSGFSIADKPTKKLLKMKKVFTVNVAQTLTSMEVGDVWNTDAAEVSLPYVQKICTQLKTDGRLFSTVSQGSSMTVIRVK